MEKITIKELIEFRGKTSGKLKNNFAFKLKTRKPKEKTDRKIRFHSGEDFEKYRQQLFQKGGRS